MIVVGTAGFAFYQYRQSQNEKLAEEKKGLIFPSLELSQIQAISIEKGNANIRVLSQEREWRMDSPVKDIADRDLIGDWIESLLSEKITVIKEKGVDWAEYGLDQNVSSIEITTISDTKIKLDISHYSAFDGRFYIRKGESLLLGNTSWASLTDKDGDYFRSYKVLNIDGHPVVLLYNSKLFKAHLKWDNYNWKWEKEEENSLFPLSHSDLESYWSSFSRISFEKEIYPNTKGLRKKFKLLEPDIELQMEFAKDKKWSLKISSEIDGKFYALISTRDYIFTLSENQRERILLTEQTIRDHRQPFQFKRNEAYFMELKGYGLDIQIKKEKDKWVLLRAEVDKKVSETIEKAQTNKEKKEEAEGKIADKSTGNKVKQELNIGELKNVLNKILTLSAKQYFGKEKSFVKTADLIVKDKEENLILKLELSDPFKLDKNKKHEDEKSKMVYVRSNIGQEIMSLKFKTVQSIFSPSLLQVTNKEEDNKK